MLINGHDLFRVHSPLTGSITVTNFGPFFSVVIKILSCNFLIILVDEITFLSFACPQPMILVCKEMK